MERSISDDELFLRTNHEGAVLITADKDFGEMVFRQRLVA
jgi:predicted nuclease of predicted toxin-antitoxin system